jgi:hypothetical protein
MDIKNLDKRIKFTSDKDPTRLISVEFVFDSTSPLFENNLNLTYNHFVKLNVLVDSKTRVNNEYHIMCGSIQAKICEYIIRDCLSLKSILFK